MSEPVKISTQKYNKQGKVDIDGHIWDVKFPGAGSELRLSQALRLTKLYGSRIELLDKKIDAGAITESELDKYEEYSNKYQENERIVFDFFSNVFRDGTEDNSEVKKWIEDTPTSIIEMAFNDVRLQANKKEADGQPEPSGSAQ